jgi:hypothetical protein
MIMLEHTFLRAVWTPVLVKMLQLCYSNVASGGAFDVDPALQNRTVTNAVV